MAPIHSVISSVVVFTLASIHSANSLTEECNLSPDRSALSCFIRSLQSQVSTSAAEVRSLTVRCSDAFFFESQLRSQHFGRLPNLESLEVDFCKIRHLPVRSFVGLDNLRRLSVQSHNSEWTSILMDVSVDAFSRLDNLKELNLAHNNLWSMPAGALCDLPSLASLNVSNNHLLDVSDLGVSSDDGCRIRSLTDLDLSNNHIASLRATDLSQATSLQKLVMRENRLSVIEDNALHSLPELREVDFSSNKLAALPPTIFNSTNNLESVLLQNNSLTLLTPELFASAQNLRVLNLSRNAISSHLLTPDTFSGLTKLQVLDLSFNQINKIDSSTFAFMSQLQVLSLDHNQIHIVSSSAFDTQFSLRLLTLGHNRIESLHQETFLTLENLTSLSIDNNQLTSFEISTSNTSQLKDLAINSNRLSSVPKFIRECTHLTTLDLGDNQIEEISGDDFGSLISLYGLKLAGNKIQKLGNDTFSNASNLHILNLARNNLETIDHGTFANQQELIVLRLDDNSLTDANGIVSGLNRLEWLNISSNRLEWFDYAFVPSSLQWLDMSRNHIGELGNFYNLKSLDKLRTIKASHNLISKIDVNSFQAVSKSLANIDLSNNLISYVGPNTFADLKSLVSAMLKNNLIEHLERDALATAFPIKDGNAASVYFSGNPLICDCKLGWIQKINAEAEEAQLARRSHFNRERRHLSVGDLEELTCTMPEPESLVPGVIPAPSSSYLVQNIPGEQFLCPYKTHCFDLCRCCDFYACDCRMQCPHGCECSHDESWSRNVITCSARNHTNVPLLIPMDATHVHLDGNNLGHVDQQNFLGRHRVRHLFLNNSNVVSLSNNTFQGLAGLKTLHLEHNRLEQLTGHEFTALHYLEELYLNDNKLVWVAEKAFESLRSLQVLRLDSNLLTSFPVWNLNTDNRALAAVFLAGNTWSCQCDFVTRFNDFLEANINAVLDYDRIQCVSNNDAIVDINCRSSANSRQNPDAGIESDTANGLELASVLVPAILAGLILLAGILVAGVFRSQIKTWLYAASTGNPSVTYESTNRAPPSSVSSTVSHANKLFDVYITYAASDADFVDATLAPTLEHSNGQHSTSYRVCLQKRDFPTNTPDISEAVTVAAESSSRVLMVLTRAYLQTEWPALKATFKRVVGSSNSKLILLFLEDISTEVASDRDLKEYVRTCPTVRWGSAGFLNKLRFFLPEPAFLTFQRNITLRTMRPSDLERLGCQPEVNPSAATTSRVLLKKKLPREAFTAPVMQPTQQQQIYSNPDMENPYQYIPDHIYHSLDQPLPQQAASRQPQQPQVLSRLTANLTSSPNPHHQPQSVFLNRNLDLVLKVEPPRNSLSPVFTAASNGLNNHGRHASLSAVSHATQSPALPQVCHSYSQSTSSGAHLLPQSAASPPPPTTKSGQEYIV